MLLHVEYVIFWLACELESDTASVIKRGWKGLNWKVLTFY